MQHVHLICYPRSFIADSYGGKNIYIYSTQGVLNSQAGGAVLIVESEADWVYSGGSQPRPHPPEPS